MFDPVPLVVGGRGQLSAYAESNESGCTVYVDDNRNPEMWAQVRLTTEQLLQLVRQSADCQQAYAAVQ